MTIFSLCETPTCSNKIRRNTVGRPIQFCADCAKIRKRKAVAAWRRKFPDKHRKNNAKWYATKRKNNRKWAAENKRRAKRWRQRNREHIRQYDQSRSRNSPSFRVTGTNN